MANIVLVHGMAATGRSWNDLKERLENAGHVVSSITLPGHANPLEYLSTDLKTYVDAVMEYIPNSEAAVLIGHSMGGFVISQVASDHPDHVAKLIYVCAMLPQEGDTISGLSSQFGTGFKAIKEEFEKAGADPLALGLQPLGPLDDAFRRSAEMDEIPRHYILCKGDLIIPRTHQESMIEGWSGTETSEIDSGPLPQYSEPDVLESHILAALV